jgi:thiamine biosynthesis lipoprotein
MVKIEQLPALGTYWWFELFDADAADQEELTNILGARLQAFDALYSRFNPESLVYRLNTEGFLPLSDVPVLEEFLELLAIGAELYEDTEGVFNFLTAGLQVAAGYGALESVRQTNTDTVPNPLTDLIITDSDITLNHGAIDLGGFAKGWLIDDLAVSLSEELGYEHFLINGGGDMFATSDTAGEPIEITIEHPNVPDTYIARLPLLNQGFASSSTIKRAWEQNGEPRQHILKTHEATVASHIVAADAMTADLFATLACVIEPADAPALLEAEGLEYLLMVHDQVVMTNLFESHLLTK